MHNWSTPYAVRILQALIPALKPGARILINDHCLRDPGAENPWDERVMRRMDMVMLALLNAQERNEAEYKELFRLASEKFVFKVCFIPPPFPHLLFLFGDAGRADAAGFCRA